MVSAEATSLNLVAQESETSNQARALQDIVCREITIASGEVILSLSRFR
jgi:hypothetical protein